MQAATARQKLEAIRASNNPATLDALWSDYLTHTQRAYTKLRIACAEGPSKLWCDKLIERRRSDELLQYLLHARNADEHGIEAITEKTEGRVLFKPKPPATSIKIDYLEIVRGVITMGPETQRNAIIELVPAAVKLVPVRDRGVTYQIPRRHRGEDFNDPTLIGVGEIGLAFLEHTLAEAAETFLG